MNIFIYQGPGKNAGYELNATEIVLANGHPFGFSQALLTGNAAKDMTVKKYGQSWGIANEIDAYRHGVWAALLTINAGEKFTKMWLNAHEFGNSENLQDWKTEQGSTRYQQTKMDLYNNTIGISQANLLIAETQPDGMNYPTKDMVSDAIDTQIMLGRMMILDW
jgi:hypothetical protein